MRMLAMAALAVIGACVAQPQTYRDLDRIGQEYEREAMAAPKTPEEATARDACGAGRFGSLVGTRADQIDRSALPAGARVIMPGQMVTMDFSPARLNVRVSPDGRVAALECF